MILVRRRLFWRIYITLLISLIIVAMLIVGLWRIFAPSPFARIGELRIHLADTLLPPRNGDPRNLQRSVEKLARIEGFRQIVVGADLQPDDPVGVVAAGRQHQDRDGGAGAQAPADLEAVDVGQHDVEHHGVETLAVERVEAVDPGQAAFHREAGGAEIIRDHGGQAGIVIDDQDAFRQDGLFRTKGSTGGQEPDPGAGCNPPDRGHPARDRAFRRGHRTRVENPRSQGARFGPRASCPRQSFPERASHAG